MPIPLQHFHSPIFAAACARMIVAVNSPDQAGACKRAWAFNGWGGTALTIFGTQAKLPAAVAAISETQIFVAISGTDSLEQMLHYVGLTDISSYLAEPSIGPDLIYLPRTYANVRRIVNPAFWQWGTTAASMVVEADQGVGRQVIFVGHSYGGAVAMAAAIQYALLRHAAKINCLTFGAPKLGGAEVAGQLSRVDYRAWVDFLDPIPALPPTEGEFGFPVKLAWKGLLYLFPGGYKFQGPGYVLFPDGQYRDGHPSNLTPTILDLLADPLGRQEIGFSPSAHRISEYLRRLELWQYQPSPPLTLESDISVLTAQAARQLPQPASSAAARLAVIQAREKAVAAKVQADAVLSLVSSGQSGSLFSGGDNMPFVPSQYSAKQDKIGDQQILSWESSVIAEGNRSQCHSLKKALNHFLRRAQAMQNFHLANFVATANTYFNEAAAGGLGFKPDQLPIV